MSALKPLHTKYIENQSRHSWKGDGARLLEDAALVGKEQPGMECDAMQWLRSWLGDKRVWWPEELKEGREMHGWIERKHFLSCEGEKKNVFYEM